MIQPFFITPSTYDSFEPLLNVDELKGTGNSAVVPAEFSLGAIIKHHFHKYTEEKTILNSRRYILSLFTCVT